MPSKPTSFDFLEPPQKERELGRIGPYNVLALIGEGGMGAVFRAEDSRLKRDVALKTMQKKWANSPVGRKRFVEEARSMAAVHHDNVATIFEVGIHEGTPFLAMEMLEGKPLNKLIKEKHQFSVEEIFRIADEVTAGLQAAHQRGIIHRDIKPANIWIESSSGRAKILDFGLAIAGGDVDRFSHRGSVLGSPAYLSPEQSRGESLDDRSDLYSLGVVLYQICSGRPPFLLKTIPEQLIANICRTPVSLHDANSDLPKPLCDLIHQLLEKEPRNRPNSASTLRTYIHETKDRCELERNAPMQIITDTHVETSKEEVSPKEKELTPTKNIRKKKPIFSKISVGILIGLSLLISYYAWNKTTQRVASEPVKQSGKQANNPPALKRITTKSLEPISIKLLTDDALSFTTQSAALIALVIENKADNPSLDPKRIHSRNKIVAQVVTLLSLDGSNEITRPAYPVKISPKRLPSRGKSETLNIQILTNDLEPNTYRITFELQTPNGEAIERVERTLIITAKS